MIPGLSCYLEVACFYARLVLKSTEKQVCPIEPKSGPRTKSGTGTPARARALGNLKVLCPSNILLAAWQDRGLDKSSFVVHVCMLRRLRPATARWTDARRPGRGGGQ